MYEKARGGGGVSRFSVEKILSHSAEKVRRRESFCFPLFSAIGKFSFFQRLCRFSVEKFCLTVPKNFRGNLTVLCLRNNPVGNKFM